MISTWLDLHFRVQPNITKQHFFPYSNKAKLLSAINIEKFHAGCSRESWSSGSVSSIVHVQTIDPDIPVKNHSKNLHKWVTKSIKCCWFTIALHTIPFVFPMTIISSKPVLFQNNLSHQPAAIRTMEVDVISYSSCISACDKGAQWQSALLLLKLMPARALQVRMMRMIQGANPGHWGETSQSHVVNVDSGNQAISVRWE